MQNFFETMLFNYPSALIFHSLILNFSLPSARDLITLRNTTSPSQLGTIHIWCPWKFSNFQDPHPLCIHVQKHLDPGCPIFKQTLLRSTTNYGTKTAPCMWTNEIKTKKKLSHVASKLTMHSVARFSLQTMP